MCLYSTIEIIFHKLQVTKKQSISMVAIFPRSERGEVETISSTDKSLSTIKVKFSTYMKTCFYLYFSTNIVFLTYSSYQ